ncbi:MAG TPA: VOC family protein [Polyangia bacterium]|nr:VOC family protein [Polyangia bacterium]
MQLGYIGFEVSDLGAWERFCVDVLGLLLADRADDGAMAFRLDQHRQRIVVEPGHADDVRFIGWEVGSDAELTGLTVKLRASGLDVTDGTSAETARRRVQRLVKLRDPNGIPTEIFFGAERAETPFASPVVRSGFVADERGLGHIVVAARDQAASQHFYCELLGLKLSDRITADVHGYKADVVFLHANQRHHSLAIGQEDRKRIHHFMLEARAMDEVGLAMDRALRGGLRLMHTLGRHPNDRMFSFYARTPSGFNFEFGWGGRDVDDATWQPTTYDHISEWGHHPPQFLTPRKPQ